MKSESTNKFGEIPDPPSGCILDRRRRSRRRPAANVSVVSGYRTRPASASKRHKTSCRRPGRAVIFEGLSPKRWSGEGCAAPSPPQPLNRDRDLSSFRSNPLAPDEKASRGGRAKLPRALVDPGQPAKHRPSPSISSSDANKLSKFLSAHCNGKDPQTKTGYGKAEHA